MPYQVAVDVGGTFTDGVLLDDQSDTIWVAKVLTTPADPGEGIATVVRLLLAQVPGDTAIDRVVHGTTLITNTLLERKGARTALVVTEGAEDALDIRREFRYDTYDLAATYPAPLVPSEDRYPVQERMGPRGERWRSLDCGRLAEIGRSLAQSGHAAFAICFLHASVDGAHEREALDTLRPLLPGHSFSLSSEVASEVGEYERMSTTVANAYVQPVVERYMRALGQRLAGLGITGRLDIMVSHGGITDAATAARFPIRLLESGPAGGVLSAINCAGGEGIGKVLAFDMGGTTAKSCVSVDGAPAVTHVFEFARVRRFKRGSGLPAVSPSIDLIEIGAGGGSIAKLSALGLMQVGPESAGAEPGPACYGLGGTEPTVTDADLVLGYLDPDTFLGGTMRLDTGRARDALARLGSKLGLDADAVAVGIHEIVNENMAAAARTHIAERGHDARGFTLVATGGAGPVHAVDVARRLRIGRVLCPLASGVGSCLGFLAAPARADRSWSRVERLDVLDHADLGERIGAARAGITVDLAAARVAEDAIHWQTTAEMRYLGQGASLPVDFGSLHPRELTHVRLHAAFEAEYQRLYGRLVPGGVAELVTWRISGHSGRQQRHYVFTATQPEGGAPAAGKRRFVYVPSRKAREEVPVYERRALPLGATFAAPAVIVEPESTLVVAHPGRVTVLPNGTIEIRLDEMT